MPSTRRSSTKEASGFNVMAKEDKVKQEKTVKEEKGRVDKGKQRAQPDDEDSDGNPFEDEEAYNDSRATVDADEEMADEDAQGEDELEGDEEEAASPHGQKRVRVNNNGDSRPTRSLVPKTEVKTLPRDVDGFIPGSIVRMQLENFVTYDYVQFRPGPQLNMIIGPNGTGKSSIACAIAIGLNWSPSVLGRAPELHSYVKQDTKSGYVEIELKSPPGKPNLVIRRTLKAESNSSTFTLNGQNTTGRIISQKMAELNVQVGNLCSFLPQDKVSEFAAMSPQRLLRETESAAGDTRLSSWHDTLIVSGKELKELQDSIKGLEKDKQQKQHRNEGIENEVLRFHERKRIEREIALLELLMPIEEYRQMHKKYLAVKAKQRQLHSKVASLRAKNRPVHDLLERMGQQLKDHEKTRDAAKTSTAGKFRKMQEKWRENDDLEKETEDLTEKLDQLRTRERDRARKIKQLEAEIKKQEEELAKPHEIEDMEVINAEARKAANERTEVTSRLGSIDFKLRQNADKKAPLNLRLNKRQNELTKLDDIDNIKLQNLKAMDPDAHDAVLWLQSNADKFKMEILRPPILSVTVGDGRYASAIESCFNAVQLRTFVAQCPEDLDTLNHYINDSGALGRPARISAWYRPPTENVPPPMDGQEMRALGFDGYAVDFVTYHPAMYNFLSKEINLHRTAVCLKGTVDTKAAMDAVSRILPNGASGGNFINGKTVNMVTRSRYGRRAVNNMTRDLRPARCFAGASVDPNFVAQLHREIQETQQELALLEEERARLEAEHSQAVQEDGEFVKKQGALKARREAVNRATARRTQLEARLKRNQDALKSELHAPSVEEERLQVKRDLLAVTQRRTGIARNYVKLARAVITEQTEATRVALEYLQISANKIALQELCQRKDEKYHKALEEFTRVDEEFNRRKAESKRLLDNTRVLISNCPPELTDEYQAIESTRAAYEQAVALAQKNGTELPSAEGVDTRSAEEMHAELENLKATLELNTSANAGIVEQYEQRKQEIEALAQQIENKTAKTRRIEATVKQTRDNWTPALERLVDSIGDKFSAAFDRIGCAGEIRISENEDYEKWAIDILVKFRDSEKLQLLTGQRQSGGERSLSTILYLMSLTEEARTPFSLVDEINQGMDQRAERSVHNNLVEVTCKPDSAQYFLITPKLLPDLKYSDRMKILCVNNGEWLPEENNIGNMMNMIEGFERRNRAPSAL